MQQPGHVTGGCRHCGSQDLTKVRGLHGAREVLLAFLLTFCFLLPGIVFYIWAETRPLCAGCGKRN